MKYYENPSDGTRAFTCGGRRMDRHDKARFLFVAVASPKRLGMNSKESGTSVETNSRKSTKTRQTGKDAYSLIIDWTYGNCWMFRQLRNLQSFKFKSLQTVNPNQASVILRLLTSNLKRISRYRCNSIWIAKRYLYHRRVITSSSAVQQPNLGLGRLIVEIYVSHTIRHTHTHTPDRTPLKEWSALLRGRYLHNTQQTQETNIHGLIGIRTHNTSNRAVVDLRLRPHGHRDRYMLQLYEINNLRM
jgi:hypothetical protein